MTVLEDEVVPPIRLEEVARPLVEPVVEPAAGTAPFVMRPTAAAGRLPVSETPGAGAPHLRQVPSEPNRPPHSPHRAWALAGVMSCSRCTRQGARIDQCRVAVDQERRLWQVDPALGRWP